MVTDSFLTHIKTEDGYEDIADDFFKKMIHQIMKKLGRCLQEQITGLIKDELGGKIMTEFVSFRVKTYSYLMDGGNSDKKAKGTKTCVIKQILKFKDYKNCLLNNKIKWKSQHRFKSEAHQVHIEIITKIPLSSDDDKRLQTFDKIISYRYGTSVGIVCKTDLL